MDSQICNNLKKTLQNKDTKLKMKKGRLLKELLALQQALVKPSPTLLQPWSELYDPYILLLMIQLKNLLIVSKSIIIILLFPTFQRELVTLFLTSNYHCQFKLFDSRLKLNFEHFSVSQSFLTQGRIPWKILEIVWMRFSD